MHIEYKIKYKIDGDIPINPDWIRDQLQEGVDKLQAEINKKNLGGKHTVSSRTRAGSYKQVDKLSSIGYYKIMKTLKQEWLDRAKEAGIKDPDPNNRMCQAFAHFDGEGWTKFNYGGVNNRFIRAIR